MINQTDSNKIETLVALTIALHSQQTPRGLDSWEEAEPQAKIDVTGISSALTECNQEAFKGCYEQYKKLTDSQQIDWLRSMLEPIVKDFAGALPFIDEHVHPSHLVALLRNEPRTIQSLILTSLPANLAHQVACSIDLISENDFDGTSNTLLIPATESERSSTDDKLTTRLRCFFLSHFITKTDLGKLTQTDLLSAVQLGRCLQLLGLKELVLTYTNLGIESNAGLKSEMQPGRITLSQKLVSDALAVTSSPNTLVDHIGLSVLARAMSRREPMYASYTAQKLPLEATSEFLDAVAKSLDESDSELYDQLLGEVECVAEHLISSPAFEASEDVQARSQK